MNALRYATRQFVRNPGFNAIVVLTLALGIGATTLIFSVIEGVLLEPLPYPQSDRIVRVYQVNEGRSSRGRFSDPNFTDLKEQNRSFAAFAQFGALNQSDLRRQRADAQLGGIRIAGVLRRDRCAAGAGSRVHGRGAQPRRRARGAD